VPRTLARSSWDDNGKVPVVASDRQAEVNGLCSGVLGSGVDPLSLWSWTRQGRTWPVTEVIVTGKNIPSDALARTVAAMATAPKVGTAGTTGDGDSDIWRKRAACQDVPTEWFFPVGRTADAVEQTKAAKAVCQSCPVQESCLGFALETNQEVGIWGGCTEDERRGLRRIWLEASRHHRSTTVHNGACSGPERAASGRLSAIGGNIKQSGGARDAALLGI
jgi:WhiB family redox-sensing transcriptional regulator